MPIRAREALALVTALDVLGGNLPAARRRLAAVLADGEADAPLLVLDAKVALAQPDVARAEAQLCRAIALEPLPITAFGLLAQLVVVEGRLDATIVEFRRRADWQPAPLAARLMAAVLARTRGDLAEAE